MCIPTPEMVQYIYVKKSSVILIKQSTVSSLLFAKASFLLLPYNGIFSRRQIFAVFFSKNVGIIFSGF